MEQQEIATKQEIFYNKNLFKEVKTEQDSPKMEVNQTPKKEITKWKNNI